MSLFSAQPFIISIVTSLQVALRNITVANGYNNTILSSSVFVDPENIPTFPITETPCVVLGHLIEPVSREFTGSRPSSVKERWRIVLECVLDVPNTIDDNQKKLNARFLFAQDVEWALTRDPQRGGIALYTYVGQDSAWPDSANQNRLYMQIPVEVLVQRVYGTV